MSSPVHHERPTIGVLAGWQIYWTARPLSYLNPIFRGIRQAATDLGCNLLLGCGLGPTATSDDPLRPAWPFPSPETDFVPIGPWNTDGLIAVVPLHSTARSRDLQQVRAAGHPVQFIGSGETGPTIVADNAGGILAAMRHLVEHGHRRIAFIAGSRDDMAGDSGARLAAYHAALAQHGLAADERLVAYGQHNYDIGYAAMRQIIESGAAFTAVLASNDESAFGALQALHDAGLRVPQEVAVIGFDDRPECVVQEPPLTSVHIPLVKMGYRAVELLLEQIGGRAASAEPMQIPTRLIVRESCGCGWHAARSWRGVSLVSAEPEADRPARLAAAMAETILAETQRPNFAAAQEHCRRLIAALVAAVEQREQAGFLQTLAEVLRETMAEGDDTHVWQAPISLLGSELPAILATWEQPATHDLAHELLNRARVAISAATLRQHQQFVVDRSWTDGRIGLLTARLLTALDENQVYQILAQHLPEMGIRMAAVVLFEAEGEDPVAWSTLRMVSTAEQPTCRFRTRDYPPAGLCAAEQPFSQALLPLVNPRGQLGYVVFDTAQLELYGAIAQQIAGALNTAQLYREATEGRRLAEEADRMKGRFLSTVSHELRTPLNLIVGLSGMLLQGPEEQRTRLPPATRRDIERIYINAQHLAGLIGDVLDLASSDAGQLRLMYEFVDLGQTLQAVAEIGRQLAADKGLGWRADVPASGPWVWGDRTRLRQVALNLIHNAVKFTAAGEISLRLEIREGLVAVSVHDTGIGIPVEEQGLIFDEFRRSERSVTRGYGGLGLGLAICKRLIELHGGAISLASTGQEGAGSTFTFTLPIVQPPAQAEKQRPIVKTSQDVLVLTSRDGAGERLRRRLQLRGLEVQVALMDEPADWQSRLAASAPAAVVLDVSRGSDQAWHALRAIKGNPTTQEIPVLFYASSADNESVLELDYLTKPIAPLELTRALDQHWLGAEAGAAGQTILVVDDDPHTLEMHGRIVQAHAPTNRVLTARSGREALTILDSEPVDLVLLDLMMPEMDGFEVLEAMRERDATRAIPVIVVTGQALTGADMARLNRGVAKVLGKGLFGLEETLTHIEAALARKRELSSEAQRLVRQAMAYLHEHYAEPISREDLARHVGLSDDYLTSCFRRELGLTPIAYLNRYRIQQAKQLLTNTHKTITEIALDVGFSGSSYFSRIFRRETGMTPEAYRRL